MNPKDTRNWDDLASLLFPDETVESCGPFSPPVHTVSPSNAERSTQDTKGGATEESSDQTIDEVPVDRKASCFTLGDKIAFVLEFKLQGKGILTHIVDALIEEFSDDLSTGDVAKKLSCRAREIAPIEFREGGFPISPMLDSGKASFQAAVDQWLSYWQSPLAATPNPDLFLSTPVLTLTEVPSTVWSSASLTDVGPSEFGDIEQSPLFSPVSIILDLAEPSVALDSSPNIASFSCKTSWVPQINRPAEQHDDESLVDFDTLMGSGPQSSGPSKPAAFQQTSQYNAPSSALGIEIPLDQLLGLGDSLFLASDSNHEASALERHDEPASSVHQECEADEEMDSCLQLDEWLQELSVSANPEDTREQAESTTLGANQLLTFDQIMELIFGGQPTVSSLHETAELDSLVGLPPATDRSTIPGNVQEEMDIEAHFEEYLKACGLL
ncbi:hypothetical protein FS837_004420 [Tulasnella sp. UAMH 9824]|nr:hypothetical protein FS837_004420 [Tulasnella sp. UAMH 9824]